MNSISGTGFFSSQPPKETVTWSLWGSVAAHQHMLGQSLSRNQKKARWPEPNSSLDSSRTLWKRQRATSPEKVRPWSCEVWHRAFGWACCLLLPDNGERESSVTYPWGLEQHSKNISLLMSTNYGPGLVLNNLYVLPHFNPQNITVKEEQLFLLCKGGFWTSENCNHFLRP